jgi:hypothetical protein
MTLLPQPQNPMMTSKTGSNATPAPNALGCAANEVGRRLPNYYAGTSNFELPENIRNATNVLTAAHSLTAPNPSAAKLTGNATKALSTSMSPAGSAEATILPKAPLAAVSSTARKPIPNT